MTTVGKILVFLNLVFSLVVGGFAVVDYTARTHWAKAFDDLKKNYNQAQQATNLHMAESQRLAKERDALYGELVKAGAEFKFVDPNNKDDVANITKRVVSRLTLSQSQIDDQQRRLERLTKELADSKAQVATLTASQLAYSKTIESRQFDSEQIRTEHKKEVDKNFQLTRDINDARDKMVQAEIRSKTLEDYNRRLLGRVTELEKLRSTGGIAGRTSTMPPNDVEGLVRRAENNLVTISLGSDNGLARGQELQVFRMGANARYIGKIRIVDVTPNQAVGQAMGRLSAPIQVGDHVASRIVGNGNN